jgi:hypothetical protein
MPLFQKIRNALFLFFLVLVALCIAFSLGMLLVIPLIKWGITGELYFPVSFPELFRLGCLVIATSLVVFVGLLASKFFRRQQ